MHTCETCGKEWPENYCPECGHTIRKHKTAAAAPPPLPGSPPPIQPRTQTQTAGSRSKSPFPVRAIVGLAVLAAIIAGGVFAYHLKQLFAFPSGYRNRPTAGWGVRMGEKEFDDANAQIDSFTGTNAFGNSADAIKLAHAFAKTLKTAREASFTPGSKLEILDKTQDEFLTYCELHSQECALIVHVPHLRKFEKNAFEYVDARKLLAQLAWITAQKVLKEQGAGKSKLELAVGLRGISQYGPITIGYYDENASKPEDGLVKYLDDGAQTHFLWTFFAPENQPRPQ